MPGTMFGNTLRCREGRRKMAHDADIAVVGAGCLAVRGWRKLTASAVTATTRWKAFSAAAASSPSPRGRAWGGWLNRRFRPDA